jgi:hypothetical protein
MVGYGWCERAVKILRWTVGTEEPATSLQREGMGKGKRGGISVQTSPVIYERSERYPCFRCLGLRTRSPG